MDAHQFGDLPQIQAMDDPRFTVWAADPHNYMQPYKQHMVSFRTDEDIYFDGFDNDASSMQQPMQRFMLDQYPLTPGMLHAKIPLDGRYVRIYEQQWPSTDCFRNPSPDRDSSGNTSQNTQDELRSPYMYHAARYDSPVEYCQQTSPYPSAEQFQGGSYSAETLVFERNISLRELQYEPVPEAVAEELEDIDLKQKTPCDHDHSAIKLEATPDYRSYADSGIGHSVRDAQSVEPVDIPEEHVSDDSDYSPSNRSGKRRRSSASTSSSGRSQKRRGHARKDSHTTSPQASTRPQKSARRSSTASKGATDTGTQADDGRPFPCPLAAYGCTSTFASKNEWKRHVSTQHIKLGYWRCDLCPPSIDPNDEQTFYYNDFNRKDLFTQHLRRMHATPKDNASRASQKEYPVTEENLSDHQTRCNLQLRSPPQQSCCLFCEREFDGPKTWEERMEHVGRHLEKDKKSRGDMLDPVAWNPDDKLERYLVDEGLVVREGGEWKIGDGKPRRGGVVESDADFEDE